MVPSQMILAVRGYASALNVTSLVDAAMTGFVLTENVPRGYSNARGASLPGLQITCRLDPVGNGSGNRGRCAQATRADAASGSVQYRLDIEACHEIHIPRMDCLAVRVRVIMWRGYG
jgi:hypothetical protein